MSDEQIIAEMAAGATLRVDDDGQYALVRSFGRISATAYMRLADAGWLHGFANGGGAWLSDKGRLQYIKSTDELGDGRLVSPLRAGDEGESR